jgi:hypothetical protein
MALWGVGEENLYLFMACVFYVTNLVSLFNCQARQLPDTFTMCTLFRLKNFF